MENNNNPEEKKTDSLVPETVVSALKSVAKGIGVAVSELWGIFVRQYLVRGLNEAFTAVVLIVASVFLQPYIGLWILVPLGIALMLCYGAIMLVGNPKYYAIEDIMGKIESFRASEAKSEYVKKNGPGRYY